MALGVAFLLSVPVGVSAAVYLEEFAPKNRLTDFIEININNLAAVPSIVFGLLGLAVFLNFFGLPRSAPLVGGMVLGLMTLPTIIIATRSALRAVSPSILDGALSLGASHTQAVFHHKVPPAASGILTGSIIGMAQALKRRDENLAKRIRKNDKQVDAINDDIEERVMNILALR